MGASHPAQQQIPRQRRLAPPADPGVKPMGYEIARPITILALMGVSTWAISRYRGYGALFSILVGWGILVAVYSAWPAPVGQWDEDREEMPSMGPFAMALWRARGGAVDFLRRSHKLDL